MKIPGPEEFLLSNVFFPGLWGCTQPLIALQAEFRWKIRKRCWRNRVVSMDFPELAISYSQVDAEPVPSIDSKMKMLCAAQECVCGGALAGTECPRHQQLSWSWSSVVVQMPKQGRALPKPTLPKPPAPSVLLLGLCPGIQNPCPTQKEKSSFRPSTQQN